MSRRASRRVRSGETWVCLLASIGGRGERRTSGGKRKTGFAHHF